MRIQGEIPYVSNNCGIWILKGKRVKTFRVSKDRWNPSHWSWQGTRQTSEGESWFQSIGESEFLEARNSYMSKSRYVISWPNQSRLSAEARGERSCRVGDQGDESPMHMTVGIVISRYLISRCREQLSIVENKWQALHQGADRQQVNDHEPSGFGKSQVSWTQTLCHQERRKPDGKLDHSHTRTGHMDYGLASRGCRPGGGAHHTSGYRGSRRQGTHALQTRESQIPENPKPHHTLPCCHVHPRVMPTHILFPSHVSCPPDSYTSNLVNPATYIFPITLPLLIRPHGLSSSHICIEHSQLPLPGHHPSITLCQVSQLSWRPPCPTDTESTESFPISVKQLLQ